MTISVCLCYRQCLYTGGAGNHTHNALSGGPCIAFNTVCTFCICICICFVYLVSCIRIVQPCLAPYSPATAAPRWYKPEIEVVKIYCGRFVRSLVWSFWVLAVPMAPETAVVTRSPASPDGVFTTACPSASCARAVSSWASPSVAPCAPSCH